MPRAKTLSRTFAALSDPTRLALLVEMHATPDSSVSQLAECRIPYGDSIGQTGLDGFVVTEDGFGEFVPKGDFGQLGGDFDR